MEDRRVGLILRALRRRLGRRQVDLARAAGVSQSVVSRVERGHLGSLSVRTLRALFAAVDARYEGDVRWRGGELDRLVDAVHAALGTIVAEEVVGLGWEVLPEVTFMRLGERGSIDLLAVRADVRAAAMFELKSEMTSFEEQQRRLDAKARVLASVVEERFGWRPVSVGVFLVLAGSSTNRGRVARVASLLQAVLPARTVHVRRWLAVPRGNLGGIWFVRWPGRVTAGRATRAPHRIRLRKAADDRWPGRDRGR